MVISGLVSSSPNGEQLGNNWGTITGTIPTSELQSFNRVQTRKIGPRVLASQSSTFFSANKNAESHDARVLSACDADFEALFLRDAMASDVGQDPSY